MKKLNLFPKKWHSLIPYGLSIAAILVFLNYLRQNADRYRDLFHISGQTLLLLFFLSILTIVLNGLSNYILYRRLGAAVTFSESIGLSTINTLANLLPIVAGGLISIGVYMKKRFALGYTRYLSAAVALYVIFVATNGLLGNAALIYWKLKGGDVPLSLVIGFCGMIASLLAFVIPFNVIRIPGKWQQYFTQAVDGWKLFSQSKMIIVQLVAVQIALMFVLACQMLLAFHSLSQNVTLTHCLLFSAVNILTQLISITPDGFGIRESLVASIAAIFGFDAGASVLAVGLVRLVVLPPVITTGILYTYFLSKKAVVTPESEGDPAPEGKATCP